MRTTNSTLIGSTSLSPPKGGASPSMRPIFTFSATLDGSAHLLEYSVRSVGMSGLGLSTGGKEPPTLAFYQGQNTGRVVPMNHLDTVLRVTDELLVFIQTSLSVLMTKVQSAEHTSLLNSTETSSREAAFREIESLILVAEQARSLMLQSSATFLQLESKLKTLLSPKLCSEFGEGNLD
jgi:hypothetical protein